MSVVTVTLVTCVDAESVEVLMVASDVVDDPMTTTFGTEPEAAATVGGPVPAILAAFGDLLIRVFWK